MLSVCLQCGRPRFDPWAGKIPWRRKWQATPVFLPGKCHGPWSLVGYHPWGCKESDTTERLHFHFHSLQESLTFLVSKRAAISPFARPLHFCLIVYWRGTQTDPQLIFSSKTGFSKPISISQCTKRNHNLLFKAFTQELNLRIEYHSIKWVKNHQIKIRHHSSLEKN